MLQVLPYILERFAPDVLVTAYGVASSASPVVG